MPTLSHRLCVLSGSQNACIKVIFTETVLHSFLGHIVRSIHYKVLSFLGGEPLTIPNRSRSLELWVKTYVEKFLRNSCIEPTQAASTWRFPNRRTLFNSA